MIPNVDRRRLFIRGLLFLSILSVTVIPPVRATVVIDPVKVRMESPTRVAEPGKPFDLILEIRAFEDVTIDDLFLNTGRSWRLAGPLPEVLHLAKDEVRRIPIRVTTDDPSEPLTLEYQVGNDVVRKAIDLSPAGEKASGPHALMTLLDPQVDKALKAGIDADAVRPEPFPVASNHRDHELSTGKAGAESKDRSLSPTSYNIHVVGFFTYRRMRDNLQVGVDGAVARVYDEDTGPDELLATQALGPDGRLDVTFNWSPCFGCDGTPDLYVEFELENSETDVHDDSIFEYDYTFETGTWQDFGGSFLDIGTQTPGNAGEMPACFIMQNSTVAWRFTALMGRDTPKVDYQWPDNDGCGACYGKNAHEIYIDSARQWNDNTVVHEFGHHWVNTFANLVDPDYCNGFCDSGSCGHCLWCQETDHDAFEEGFADYYQDVVFRTSIPNPNTAARTYESLMNCTDTGVNALHDPLRTEGIYAALLHDIDDAAQDDDPAEPKGKDELNLGYDEIFWITDFHAPTSPQAFIDRLLQEYPGLKEQFWATGMNNGYQTDFAAPGKVTNLTSDHTLNSNSDTRPNIKWMWTRASDDASGIAGYSVWVQQGILPGMPDNTMDIGDVTTWTSGPYPAGWYYISIRAVDRNGVWSNTYETAGPFGIRNPDPANLAIQFPSNWQYLGATARHVPDAQQFNTLGPSWLDGAGGTTYLSGIFKNAGESATASQFWATLYLDLYPRLYYHRQTALNPGIYDYMLNYPLSIPGGRHVVGIRVDDSDFMMEPNEADNQWGRQWAWTAPWLGLGTPTFYTSPPPRYQGTEWITDGAAYSVNSRGFRAQDEVQNLPNTMWTAITLHATDGADYDLGQFTQSDDPNNAFFSAWTSSVRGAYATDAILVNSWQGAGTPIPFDYGVVNYSGGNPDVNSFCIQKVTSANIGYPGNVSDILHTNEMMKLYQFYSAGGPLYARVKVTNPALGQVYLSLIPQSFVSGPVSSAGTLVVSDPVTGEGIINVSQAGYQCLVVWRDPIMGNVDQAFTLSVQATPTDMAVKQPPGWAAPLVPRGAADGTPGNVPAPALLIGDAAMTYVNYAMFNESTIAPPPAGAYTTVYADGAVLFNDSPVWPAPGGWTYRNLGAAFTFRGGRHVLGINLDSSDEVIEMTNANNTTAGQWVWRPSLAIFDIVGSRAQPAARDAGWNIMPPETPLLYNMDGFRTVSPSPDGAGNNWKVAAFVIPDAGKDVDLKLFEASPGATTGFDTELASSSWGIDQPDFVIADFRVTSPRQFDVGLLAPIVSPGTSATEVRRSTYLGQGPAAASVVQPASVGAAARTQGAMAGGIHGPFTIGASHLFDLYEVNLPLGTYEIRLVPGTGSIDWGFGLYGPGAFHGRSESIPDGTAFDAPVGTDEVMRVTIYTAGLHSLVVWKNRRSDSSTSGTFTLKFNRQTTGVPEEGTRESGSLISAVRPNPFAGSTTIDVDLKKASDVTLQVFDLSGRRLHTESLGGRDPGRVSIRWDGRDDNGEFVPAGIYFVRVTAGTESADRKLIRVR